MTNPAAPETDHKVLHEPALLPDLMIKGLNAYDDRPLMYLGDRTTSYKQVRERTSQFVQALASKGIGVGSSVAVLSANRPEVLYNMLATGVAGCRTTALHPLGSAEDHAYVLNDAAIETLVYDAEYFDDHVAKVIELAPGVKHLLAIGSDSKVGENYATLADRFEVQPLVRPDIVADDIGTVVYTGGTTGQPKGVMLPFRSAAYMTQIQMAEWEWPTDEPIRFLVATPLSHAAGAVFVPTILSGGALYVMSGFSPDEFFEMVDTHKINATLLVPVMIYFLLDDPRSATADMRSMTTLFYGASAMNPTRLREGIEKWGPIFFQFYGQSEAPMVLSAMTKADHIDASDERLTSCGRPSPWVRLGLLDDDLNEVPHGQAGEICVRAPLVMREYLNKPDQTAETTAGGWLHTGDIGRLDDDGFLYIVDRKKDMIITGGFNVFPREIEDVIGTHEAVAQVSVIGVPDDKWGEAVKAVVVKRPEATEADDATITAEIKALVKEAKGAVQSPKSVDFVEAIPLSALGKPDKKALRAQYWEGATRGVN